MQLYFSFTLPHVVLLHSLLLYNIRGLTWWRSVLHLVFCTIILFLTLPLP